jgi:hypothetical protein
VTRIQSPRILSLPATYRNRFGAPTSFSIIGSSRLPAFPNFHQCVEIAAPNLDRWRRRLLAGRAAGLLARWDRSKAPALRVTRPKDRGSVRLVGNPTQKSNAGHIGCVPGRKGGNASHRGPRPAPLVRWAGVSSVCAASPRVGTCGPGDSDSVAARLPIARILCLSVDNPTDKAHLGGRLFSIVARPRRSFRGEKD